MRYPSNVPTVILAVCVSPKIPLVSRMLYFLLKYVISCFHQNSCFLLTYNLTARTQIISETRTNSASITAIVLPSRIVRAHGPGLEIPRIKLYISKELLPQSIHSSPIIRLEK